MHYQSLIERLQKMYPIDKTANSKKRASYNNWKYQQNNQNKNPILSPKLRYTRPTPNFIKFIPYRRRSTRSGKDIKFIIILAVPDGTHKVGFGDRPADRSTLINGGEKIGVVYIRERGRIRRDDVVIRGMGRGKSEMG